MKAFILATALTGAIATQAQTWCPPGAEFWYEHMSAGESGYMHAAYVGDTLIDGQIAQRLEQYKTGFDFWLNMPYHTQYPDVLTRRIASQVSYRDGNAWHILFDLDVPPGGQWPLTAAGFEDWIVLVMDTGHMVVDGIALRWSHVAFSTPNGVLIPDTAIDRIGFKGVFLEPWRSLMQDGEVQGLRCYTDEDLNYSTGLSTQCDFILGTRESFDAVSIQVLPNPGTDKATIRWLGAGGFTAAITDPMGRMVHKVRVASGSVDMDTSGLASGPYVVQFQAEGVTRSMLWIKQ